MIGLDSNILVQLAVEDHPAHAKTIAAIQAHAQRAETFVFPTLVAVATEFLHIVTDERRINPPLTMRQASTWLKEFRSNPSVQLVHANDASVDQTIEWIEKFKLGRKRILDTHLAAILHKNGVSRLFTSNPADFTVFEVFELITP